MSTILLTANSAWYIVNFRSGLIRELQNLEHNVIVLVPDDEHIEQLKQLGCTVVSLRMDNKGTSPLRDGQLMLRFYRKLRNIRPDAIFSFTVKNNVYCGLAARWLGIPFLPNVSGLGTAFVNETWLTKIVVHLSRMAFRNLPMVIFQNDDDRALFIERGIVSLENSVQVPGSGVNLERFSLRSLPSGKITTFLLVARLIWDKGVGEFVEVARQMREAGWPVRCQILGFLDVQNHRAINRATVEAWEAEGVIQYLGAVDDVRPALAAADCVVLPTFYREGTPRSLLEGSAMGRPVITTDTPGCRDVVIEAKTGYLCEPRDITSLYAAMERFVLLSKEERVAMGLAARQRMEQVFDEMFVIKTYIDWLNKIPKQSD